MRRALAKSPFRARLKGPAALGCWFLAGLNLGAAQIDPAGLPPAATRHVDFIEHIQPLLVERCHRCHGADKQENNFRLDLKAAALRGGESGPAILPGNSRGSRLIHLVAGAEEGLVMPKKGERLTAEQVGLLRAWIDQGAHWPEHLAGPKHDEKKTGWWAFQPATRPAVPRLGHAPSTSVHPIDAFIRAKLKAQRLQPSPEADRRTLIRRVTFNLIGLPPTPAEVDAFIADRSPDAYARVVDRLLASPHYGERWARHWLDVVHFGETHGYDKDKLRPNAWPYRDYVIGAFNADKPYPRFIEEQLAGDVLFADEPEGIVALGFIAAGPWDFVGHVELPITKTDGLIARYNDRDDMVMTAMSTFQSLTVHCARCHDHKFDPISQRDYYALQAVFAGVDRANRPYDTDRETHRTRRSLTAEKRSIETRLAALKVIFAQVTSPELQRINSDLARVTGQLGARPKVFSEKKSPSNGYHSSIEAAPGVSKWVQVDLGRSLTLDQIRLVPARPTDFPDTPGFGFPLRFKVECSEEEGFTRPLVLADHTQADFKNPGDIAFNVKGSTAPARYLRVTATRLWERTSDYVFALAELQAFAGGTNVAQGGRVTAHDTIESGRWSRKFLVDGFSSRQHLAEVLPTAEEMAQQRALENESSRLERERVRLMETLADPQLKAEAARLEMRLTEVETEIKRLPATKLVYAAANDFKPEGSFIPPKGMRPVHLLLRGEVKRPKEVMAPAALPSVPGPEATFDPDVANTEGGRRAALAKWMTDRRNLQTRRSIVNRVWQYHFGKGIVDTANDFGRMGGLPSHPELLDWLAFWFLDQGESLKKLHRLIVTSETYRQASDAGGGASGAMAKRAAEIDGDNRLLWRMNRIRLDAECIHDAMLLVSGRLDRTMGGASDRQFFFKDDHSPVYDYTRFDVDSPAGARRSIYRHIVRSVADPFLDCLDAADPSQLVARRSTTLTALQALATLNDPFVLRQCEHFAARLEQLSPDLNLQVENAYRLALSRNPSAPERQRVVEYARKHGLANACRVLFNSTEFMFVD
jgi:mono/diheme cytochrome c family protein